MKIINKKYIIMINVQFNYNGAKINIQCNKQDTTRSICEKFATKAQINIDSKIYICDGKTLSIKKELNLSFSEQINLEDTNEKEIMVLDDRDKEYTINVNLNGENKLIKAKGDESYESLMSKISNLFNRGKNKLFSIYNGNVISDDEMNKEISQISKSIDKEEKRMDIIIQERQEEEEEEKKVNNIETDLIEESEKKKEENDDEMKIVRRSSINTGKFLLRINLILLLQFSLIELLTVLGFYFNISNIFTNTTKSMVWTFICVSLFTIFISLFITCYEETFEKSFFIALLFFI